jgi:hypothetical protein
MPTAGGAGARRAHDVLDELETQRRKLLRLFYDDRIGADLFAEEEARLTKTIAATRSDLAEPAQVELCDNLSLMFDEVARILAHLDIERI